MLERRLFSKAHVLAANHLTSGDEQHHRAILRVIMAEVDSRFRFGIERLLLVARKHPHVAAKHAEVARTGLHLKRRLDRSHTRLLVHLAAVPDVHEVAHRVNPVALR